MTPLSREEFRAFLWVVRRALLMIVAFINQTYPQP